MFLGKIICNSRSRQKRLSATQPSSAERLPPPAPFPQLTDGILRRNGSGVVQALRAS